MTHLSCSAPAMWRVCPGRLGLGGGGPSHLQQWLPHRLSLLAQPLWSACCPARTGNTSEWSRSETAGRVRLASVLNGHTCQTWCAAPCLPERRGSDRPGKNDRASEGRGHLLPSLLGAERLPGSHMLSLPILRSPPPRGLSQL